MLYYIILPLVFVAPEARLGNLPFKWIGPRGWGSTGSKLDAGVSHPSKVPWVGKGGWHSTFLLNKSLHCPF